MVFLSSAQNLSVPLLRVWKSARVFIAVLEVLATDKCVSTEECIHSWCWLLPFLEPPCWFSKALSSFPVEVMEQ